MAKFILSLLFLASVLVPWGPAAAAEAEKELTLEAVEEKMVRGGYLPTLHAGPWAVEQGEHIIPLLEKLLENKEKYEQQTVADTGAFPFNVLWALAHFRSNEALKVLEKYYARTKDETAALALKACRVREAKGSRKYAILSGDGKFYKEAREAKPLKELKAGQMVKVLKEMILNNQEEGPMGGPACYDQVELVPGGEKGFIKRAGDNFTPFI